MFSGLEPMLQLDSPAVLGRRLLRRVWSSARLYIGCDVFGAGACVPQWLRLLHRGWFSARLYFGGVVFGSESLAAFGFPVLVFPLARAFSLAFCAALGSQPACILVVMFSGLRSLLPFVSRRPFSRWRVPFPRCGGPGSYGPCPRHRRCAKHGPRGGQPLWPRPKLQLPLPSP